MIAEITFNERLGQMLNWLESEGFYLYFDEVLGEWELMSPDSEYSVTCADKNRCITQGFSDLCH